ncbi:FAD-dependent 5-carboxymethylaminomethyl-2-thiouridine(34) oxidoreductase MnmC [Halofilum ochraceum]|uniref:FAD-dependent 5-carboxymethylaminomethyl-2-thiouridine(34) oxidoreductase MnmC n=1 Tax=Halofilum ochraceum TaxID=1611323 RepID=UPI0008D9D1FE|nr:FAD-dependent 5-carboxymethylaminomethyl-2-thiouridine(34) oxidoreductase MnmC [Halofilum ochraceum]
MSRRPRTALIIGGGLAGSAAAAVLARRGWRVTLIADDDADRASDIPAAVMAATIGGATDPLTRLRRRGLNVTESWLAHLERAGFDCGRTARGTLLLPGNERDRARHRRVPPDDPDARHVTPADARAAIGIEPPSDGVLHRRGACIQPDRLANALRSLHAGSIHTRGGRVERLVAHEDGWTAQSAAGEPLATATTAIIAAGTACTRLWPESRRWLLPARGQATAFRATAASAGLRVPISGGGYITPAIGGTHWVGATLQRGDTDPAPRAEDDQTNLAFAQRCLGLAEIPEAIDRFVGFRATTPNRIPLVGRLADNLWITAGHGAHGLLTTPLAAQLLANAIDGHRHPLLRFLSPENRRDGHPTDANLK